MRITYLSDTSNWHIGRWAGFFAKRGHDVSIITWNPEINADLKHFLDVSAVRVVEKRASGSGPAARVQNYVSLRREVRRLLKDLRPDVVHAHTSGSYAWMAMLSGFRPYIVTPWGDDILIDAVRSKFAHYMTGLALRRAALVTTDGYHVQTVIKDYGLPAERIPLIMFGVNMRRFNGARDRNTVRAELGLRDEPVIVSTRTLAPIHDVERFVRAMPLIKEQAPAVRFVVVGDGVQRERLEGLTAELGVTDAVKFTGRVDEKTLSGLLLAADIYVSSSVSDAGLASSTAEAMACGLPVVHADNADNREWVSDGNGGFVFPNGDAMALAEAVVRLLKDPALRERAGKHNRSEIERRNNYETEMAKMEDLYRRVSTAAS